MNQSSLLLLLALVAFLIVMMIMSNRAQKKQRAERANMISELSEGVWVLTIGRMYGRVVDIDGDVVTLETADGSELMFDKTAIAAVKEPPIGVDNEDEDGSVAEIVEDDNKESDTSAVKDFNGN